MVDFPFWFHAGCYGGLACCISAMVFNALYTTLRKRGNSRQLVVAIVVCIISTLLLLPALIWFRLRFSVQGIGISQSEVEVMLLYVSVWGWVLPLSVTASYLLYSRPRIAIPIATTQGAPSVAPPPVQTGSLAHGPAPFVFNNDEPWGWLEYGSGNFQGQRLALKRMVATMGRDEECDIWIDDDMASRHHADICWQQSQIYLTDCNSLNGVLLNGERIQGTTEIKDHDIIEIGAYRFVFLRATRQETPPDAEASDPLAHHTWRSVLEEASEHLPASLSPNDTPRPSTIPTTEAASSLNWQTPVTPLLSTSPLQHLLIVLNGPQTGRRLALDKPTLLLGYDENCDIVLADPSLARHHARFLHQTNGDFVQDLAQATLINNEPLRELHQLQPGEILTLGTIRLEYARVAPVARMQTTSMLRSGPTPLRLPSRPKSE